MRHEQAGKTSQYKRKRADFWIHLQSFSGSTKKLENFSQRRMIQR